MLWLLVLVFAFADRLGGGGFEFVSAKLPAFLRQGHLWARRQGIPVLLWLTHPTLSQAVLCAAMGAIFTFNNSEVAERDWQAVFLQGFGLSAALILTAGVWALLVPAWWLLACYLSNVGVSRWKLGWHWAELGRGLAIGVARALGG